MEKKVKQLKQAAVIIWHSVNRFFWYNHGYILNYALIRSKEKFLCWALFTKGKFSHYISVGRADKRLVREYFPKLLMHQCLMLAEGSCSSCLTHARAHTCNNLICDLTSGRTRNKSIYGIFQIFCRLSILNLKYTNIVIKLQEAHSMAHNSAVAIVYANSKQTYPVGKYKE
ncbi:ATP-dependent Clp protease proteolytic subunit [Frankliniella fusca]|uniref:ATP-dependent Clp protease proteolytic subunit n=1 Tax=Frankliniella fusca TaxID=407009 RepID=A0AAE1HZE4_9NEOP|nr:ATP-dependent Clp protease proteolytic subunit [Frankliniella fusca]KAK3930717.1 ATP-dependent Clp protease proteolytic subunit [Frankliniella fusca]